MRLGEIRNTLRNVLTETNLISIKSEAIFEGKAYIVDEYRELMAALDILSAQSWNELDYAQIKDIRDEYDFNTTKIQLPVEKFNQINSYVSALNSKLPLYVSILETMVEDQDEKIINIKLSNNINSLEDLNAANKKLESLFKKFTLGGDFKFEGFDKGTEWYEILITTPLLYTYFISCVDVGIRVCELTKVYYESQEAKLSYKASLREDEKFTETAQKKHSDKYMDAYLEEEVGKIVDEIGKTDGRTNPELTTNLVLATKELVEQLGEGVEFHLSLNPPEYAEEKAGILKIDYKSIPTIKIEEKKEVKKVEAPKEDDEQ